MVPSLWTPLQHWLWQVGPDGAAKEEIEKLAGAMAKVGLSQCMQSKWLRIDKTQVLALFIFVKPDAFNHVFLIHEGVAGCLASGMYLHLSRQARFLSSRVCAVQA